MTNKKFLAGMFGLILVFGMAFAGCDNGTTDGEKGEPKKITITGLAGKTGDVMVVIATGIGEAGLVAVGQGTIANNSVTVSLKKQDNSEWRGTGSYYMEIYIVGDEIYEYTNGKTQEELGVYSQADFAKLPKYNITETISVIAFSRFRVFYGI